jgi:hypothetical protein
VSAKPKRIAAPKDTADVVALSNKQAIAQAKATGKVTTTGAGDFTYDELMAMLAKAHKGDAKAWAIVREIMETDPNTVRDSAPSPDAVARALLLDAVLGEDLPTKAAYKAQAEALVHQLAGPNPTALELLLCQSAATCWLDANFADSAFSHQSKQTGGGIPLGVLKRHELRRERAHARYLATITALARVRRLLTPVAQQVNIAQPGAQQLNVAQPGAVQENRWPLVAPPAPAHETAERTEHDPV